MQENKLIQTDVSTAEKQNFDRMKLKLSVVLNAFKDQIPGLLETPVTIDGKRYTYRDFLD